MERRENAIDIVSSLLLEKLAQRHHSLLRKIVEVCAESRRSSVVEVCRLLGENPKLGPDGSIAEKSVTRSRSHGPRELFLGYLCVFRRGCPGNCWNTTIARHPWRTWTSWSAPAALPQECWSTWSMKATSWHWTGNRANRNLFLGIASVCTDSWTAGRQARVVARVGHRREPVVNRRRAPAEVAFDFSRRRNRQNLRVRLHEPQAFVVDEEEGLLPSEYRTTERTAEFVLHQMIVPDRIKRAGIQRAIAQKFISRAVIFARSRTRHDVDLPSARASHIRGVTAGLHLEFFTASGDGLKFCVLKVGSVFVTPSNRK